MRDGLYVVNRDNITAAFVVRDGDVTVCAPILRKKLDYWKKIARWIPSDPAIPPPAIQTDPVE